MKKFICGTIALSCAILILGAIGDSTLGFMGELALIKRCLVATPILYVSLEIGGFLND